MRVRASAGSGSFKREAKLEERLQQAEQQWERLQEEFKNPPPELSARARAGDAEGAYRRLSRFAQRAEETRWAGDNSFTITAEPKGDGEPYLADMVVATAAVVHGILGITPCWERLETKPCLPDGWSGAEAEVLYKGRRHRVTIEGGKVRIQPLDQVIQMPLLWVMDWNLQTSASGVAEAPNIDFGDLSYVALEQAEGDRAESGTYQSPAYDWTMPAKLHELTVAADGPLVLEPRAPMLLELP